MNGEMVNEARRWVRSRFGSALEAKATDELAVKLLAGAATPSAEASAPPEPTVLEFEPVEDLGRRAREAAENLESLAAFRTVIDRVRELAPRTTAPGRLIELSTPLGGNPDPNEQGAGLVKL